MLNTWESNISWYVWLSAERTLRGNADFFVSKAPGLTRGRARFKHGGMLMLLKYPFYPLFILDNGMNLISKSLTVLTRPNYWSFSHLHIYFGGTSILQVLAYFGAWNDEARDRALTRKKTKAKAQRKDQGPCWFEAHSCTSILQESPKDQAHEDEIKILRD